METLHADLITHVDDEMVHHPLVIAELTSDASRINHIYYQKIKLLAKAEADGDWSTYVFLHERPYRLGGLLAATKKGLKDKPSDFWALMGSVWCDSENIHSNLSKWKRLWGTTVEGRRACMSKEDLCVFDSLPEQIDVWRGASQKRYIDGYAWTLDQEIAVWFARRFYWRSRVPVLAKGTVKKNDVLAYFGGRNEREIVSMRVSIVSVRVCQ